MQQAEVDQRVKSMAELMDLTSVLSKQPSSLAGGHQQRVSLARAFIRKPNVTLLDEPISHMDQRVRAELRARIRRLHNELGLTTIYVTHDQAEATSLCDRLAIINDAELQQVGTVDDIWNWPSNRFVAYFIGEPSMNFISARIETVQGISIATPQGKKVFNIRGHVDPKYVNAEITMGVRPQQIKVLRKDDGASIPGSVRIVEFKGETTVLTIQLGDAAKSEVKAVVQATERFGIEETVHIHISPEIIHLFDQDTPILQRK
jgi:multiple sugar transport system ATP-binding protein